MNRELLSAIVIWIIALAVIWILSRRKVASRKARECSEKLDPKPAAPPVTVDEVQAREIAREMMVSVDREQDAFLFLYLALVGLCNETLPVEVAQTLQSPGLIERAHAALKRGEIFGATLDEFDREMLMDFTRRHWVDHGNGARGPSEPVGDA